MIVCASKTIIRPTIAYIIVVLAVLNFEESPLAVTYIKPLIIISRIAAIPDKVEIIEVTLDNIPVGPVRGLVPLFEHALDFEAPPVAQAS